MIELGTGIVYANTVERAYRYWTYLRERTRDRAGDLPRPALSQSVYGAGQAEGRERARRGPTRSWAPWVAGAWEAEAARGIAVLTQIGEMSVNISAPLMLSDLCPWDRLAQRAGRLARFKGAQPPRARSTSPTPSATTRSTPAPYGSFDGPKTGWTAGAPLLDTQARSGRTRCQWPGRADTGATGERGERAVSRTRAARRADPHEHRELPGSSSANNWMIVPATPLARQRAPTVPGQWKSRDIPAQRTIYGPDRGRRTGGWAEVLPLVLRLPPLGIGSRGIRAELPRGSGAQARPSSPRFTM